MTTRHDVVIIGGGLGGLACALLLAQTGRSVLVLEQGAQAGGCLQSYRRSGGLSFDTGFHCVGSLGEGQSLHDAFQQLGLMSLPWHRLDADGADRVLIGEREFCMAEGFDSFASRLADEFPADRAALADYAELMRRSLYDTDAELATRLMSTNAYDYLRAHFRDPLLADVLAGAATRLELRRESLPLFVLLHCTAPYVESSWRLRGSGDLIVRTLADGLRARGGTLLCRAEVVALDTRDGRVEAARCRDGRRFPGDLFVSSAHPAATCRMVEPTLKGVYPRRIGQLENTGGMLTVSLVLKPQTVRYFNHNEYIYRRPDVWALCDAPGGPVGGVMASCRVPSGMQDGQADAWAEQIDLLAPLRWEHFQRWATLPRRQRGADYAAAKDALADECIALAERFLPGLSRHVAGRYVSTPLTWRDYTLTPCGSAFGVRKDCRQPLLTMLSPRTPIPNLLLTGQSLGLHGLQGTVMTALRTCKEAEKVKR